MACIKTGAQVYLTQYGRYMICDIYRFDNGLWILRATPPFKYEPIWEVLHATISKVTEEWTGNIHTIVVEPDYYTYYGYDGVPCVK